MCQMRTKALEQAAKSKAAALAAKEAKSAVTDEAKAKSSAKARNEKALEKAAERAASAADKLRERRMATDAAALRALGAGPSFIPAPVQSIPGGRRRGSGGVSEAETAAIAAAAAGSAAGTKRHAFYSVEVISIDPREPGEVTVIRRVSQDPFSLPAGHDTKVPDSPDELGLKAGEPFNVRVPAQVWTVRKPTAAERRAAGGGGGGPPFGGVATVGVKKAAGGSSKKPKSQKAAEEEESDVEDSNGRRSEGEEGEEV
ncbi:hypothetical protein T492DRAFT_847436 [Pavlovales sp. CCMP2436]|nr:hypothetical protein T492DRAFT_847436 [Pavlovales sp. CCMP2436]